MLVYLLIPTQKLSAGSSPVPRQRAASVSHATSEVSAFFFTLPTFLASSCSLWFWTLENRLGLSAAVLDLDLLLNVFQHCSETRQCCWLSHLPRFKSACLLSLYSFWASSISVLSIPLSLIYMSLINVFQNLQEHLISICYFSLSSTSIFLSQFFICFQFWNNLIEKKAFPRDFFKF